MSIKKLLFVFDTNCVLGYRQKTKILNKELKGIDTHSKMDPHIIKEGYSTYYRPNSEVLLNTLFVKKKKFCDFAIWANQTKEETEIQLNQFLKSLKYQMKFVLFTNNRVDYDSKHDIMYDINAFNKKNDEKNSINSIDNSTKDDKLLLPKQISRDLNIIFTKHPEYNEKNTVVISNFQNLDQRFIHNDIIIPNYHPTLGQTAFFRDPHLYILTEYLQFLIGLYDVNHVTDVREGIKQLNYNKLHQLRTGSHDPNRLTLRHTSDDIRF